MTMALISTTTVGSGGVSSVTFSAIPGTFTDLYLVHSARNTRGGENQLKIEFNGSTSNYTQRSLVNNSASVSSLSATSIWGNALNDATQTASVFSSGSFYIFNYSGSTNKALSMDSGSENNGASVYTFMTAGQWADSAAITSIVLTGLYGETLVQHSSFSLYGITKGSGGATIS